jgi:hypothetical protein
MENVWPVCLLAKVWFSSWDSGGGGVYLFLENDSVIVFLCEDFKNLVLLLGFWRRLGKSFLENDSVIVFLCEDFRSRILLHSLRVVVCGHTLKPFGLLSRKKKDRRRNPGAVAVRAGVTWRWP